MTTNDSRGPAKAGDGAAGSGVGLPPIRVVGARTHNLRNVTVEIPRNRITVLTGPSGSGKSSLAFDTLFAEGQRRYVETLSPYVRQFLDQLPRPDVDSIEGLPPTVALSQQGGPRSPRSTVASLTEILDFLRVLFARVGTPHCPRCRGAITRRDPSQIVAELLARVPGARALVLAPLARGRKGDLKEVLGAARREGFPRLRVDGAVVPADRPPALDKKKKHDVEIVVDRVRIGPEAEDRLRDSLATALKLGGGVVIVSLTAEPDREPGGRAADATSGKSAPSLSGKNRKSKIENRKSPDLFFSDVFTCPRCGTQFDELSPRSFSFNSPYGACPACEGLGTRPEFDSDLLIPDAGLSLAEGALAPFRGGRRGPRSHIQDFEVEFTEGFGVSRLDPISRWSEEVRAIFLDGTTAGQAATLGRAFRGLLSILADRHEKARPAERRRYLPFLSPQPCRVCRGGRLRPESAAVTVGGRALPDVLRMTAGDALTFFDSLPALPGEAALAGPLVEEIRGRLRFLKDAGVEYLALGRTADTLSGGEYQRVRLGHHIGSSLSGVLYVLDEPTIGLHPSDHGRLLGILRRLRDLGNTVLVVEHEAAVMRAADHLVDLGPGAGPQGGRVVAQGPPAAVEKDPASITGRFLSGAARIEVPRQRRPTDPLRRVEVQGARGHNLKGVDFQVPLGTFTCVTGVSGAGKSSLVFGTLLPALAREILGRAEKPLPHDRVRGAARLSGLVEIDPSPIGRTPRSIPATFTGVMDPIRLAFAAVPEARIRGFGPNHFSFNARGGRCEACAGQGVRRIEMQLLPDLYVTCDACKGTRFQKGILTVRYRGRSIAEVLDLTVSEAADFFARHPKIARVLKGLIEVGLGYLKLGQNSLTLSGGEAERLKLAGELFKGSRGPTLYLLDEPTTGLHFEDVQRLLDVLNRLVDAGNTVLVIEHDLDVIKTADHVVDLGPGGGEAGGRIVAEGPPEAVARAEGSVTGACLRGALGVGG